MRHGSREDAAGLCGEVARMLRFLAENRSDSPWKLLRKGHKKVSILKLLVVEVLSRLKRFPKQVRVKTLRMLAGFLGYLGVSV